MGYELEYQAVLERLPYLLGGAVLTLQIAVASFAGGGFIGLLGALGKVYGRRPVRLLINSYVLFFTNTPALVQIFFLFYALPEAGILLPPLVAVLIGLVLNAGAYLTDILRAGVVSVRKAEIEAGQTLGMSNLQLLRHVMLPHIATTIYGPLSNFFIWLVLGSSLAALFAVEELTGRAINISTASLRTIETFSVVAVIYVLLTFAASMGLALLGRYLFRVKVKVF
jgi:polar amino acid transport system permease protein